MYKHFYDFIFLSNEHNQEKKSEALDIVKELLNAGAHTDFVNKKGVCPHTSFLTSNDLILITFSFGFD